MFARSAKPAGFWGTGMAEKVVWRVVRCLGCKQRIRAAGNDRIWDRAGWLTGPFSRTHLTIADHSGKEAFSMTIGVGELAGNGVPSNKNGGR